MGRVVHFEIHVDDMERAQEVLWRGIRMVIPRLE